MNQIEAYRQKLGCLRLARYSGGKAVFLASPSASQSVETATLSSRNGFVPYLSLSGSRQAHDSAATPEEGPRARSNYSATLSIVRAKWAAIVAVTAALAGLTAGGLWLRHRKPPPAPVSASTSTLVLPAQITLTGKIRAAHVTPVGAE